MPFSLLRGGDRADRRERGTRMNLKTAQVILGIALPALVPLFLPSLVRLLRRRRVASDIAKFRLLLAADRELTGFIGDGESIPAAARDYAVAVRRKVNREILAETRIYPARRTFRLIAASLAAIVAGWVMLAPMHGAYVFEGLLANPFSQIALLVVITGAAMWTTEKIACARRVIALRRPSPLLVRIVLCVVLLPLTAFVVYRVLYFIDFLTHFW